MITVDLEKYGPDAPGGGHIAPHHAREYCGRLARRHYENFTVASLLLPRPLRQHFYNVYAYCRWADDLADETGDPARSRELLDWWGRELEACYQGRTSHPVFVALAETIEQFAIPINPLADLLVAFRQDQETTRYETHDDVLGYCRNSADPVGRLVLYLGRCCTPDRAALSDSVCTGLQLANFCQDVASDFDRGRIYLPQSECRRVGYTEDDFAARRPSDAFRRLLAGEVDRAESYLRRGWPLVGMVPREFQLQIALFIRGGLAILDAIRRQDYDVWTARPVVSKMRKLALLAGTWWRLRREGGS